MKGYGSRADVRKKLDAHEDYSAEVWEERYQEKAHEVAKYRVAYELMHEQFVAMQGRADVAEAKYEALREAVANLADEWDRPGMVGIAPRLRALLTEGAE